ERSWVKVVGHRDTPGKPAMYATTREFLDYFNLKTLGELPSLADIKEITSLNQELELEAVMTIALDSGDAEAAADLSEAGAVAANESENEADTDTVEESANEVLAEVDADAASIAAEGDTDVEEEHGADVEPANAQRSVTDVDLNGVSDYDAEIDEDTADLELPAYSQSHS
ncbi:MAG: SMC-Scp complex subunit ScpB, partial [Pseudomonadales bacterium]